MYIHICKFLCSVDKTTIIYPPGYYCHYYYQDNIMADAFFRVFDEDKSGALSFYEYMLVKTAPKLESQEDRLGWIFHAFDSDGGGSIDNTEVKWFFNF